MARQAAPVRKPAATARSFRVDVFLAPPPRERRRGAKPKPLGVVHVTAASADLARADAKKELEKKYPGRRLRSFSSNNRTGGFVAYYQEEGN